MNKERFLILLTAFIAGHIIFSDAVSHAFNDRHVQGNEFHELIGNKLLKEKADVPDRNVHSESDQSVVLLKPFQYTYSIFFIIPAHLYDDSVNKVRISEILKVNHYKSTLI